jgi:hypothetical protein
VQPSFLPLPPPPFNYFHILIMKRDRLSLGEDANAEHVDVRVRRGMEQADATVARAVRKSTADVAAATAIEHNMNLFNQEKIQIATEHVLTPKEVKSIGTHILPFLLPCPRPPRISSEYLQFRNGV